MKQFIRGWWHIISAVLAGVYLLASGTLGWVGEVNASMQTTADLEVTAVRKDVLNETMKRIEHELMDLNKKFDRAFPEGE